MIEIAFSNSFKRAYKKRIKSNLLIDKLFKEKLNIFLLDPFDKRLRTHKLSGKLSDVWSFSVTYHIRVTFIFIESNKVLFESVGNHDEVY